ncbi:MAG: sigma-54-dependent Fis family transcriptional regulator [Deltaproteobacteria bacterium]|nr:sigma-54-dependent Fis family transcriptional regulator [Deltaproteobacteria bacterium]
MKSNDKQQNTLPKQIGSQKTDKPFGKKTTYNLGRHQLIGHSELFTGILEQAQKVKGHKEANVVLEGETGTGKELLARFINLTEGLSRPFVAVNCSAIAKDLFESELFGHEKGSFTGALKQKPGLIEQAQGGDLFLDEVNSLPLNLQAKLLRVLQEKEFYRVGGSTPIRVNFRIICATNQNLRDLVASQEFREDLYYRLNVVNIVLPPLRERKADIPLLTHYFIRKHRRHHRNTLILDSDVMKFFKKYAWPGNIRELENAIQALCIMHQHTLASLRDLPGWLRPKEIDQDKSEGAFGNDSFFTVSLQEHLDRATVMFVEKALEACGWNKTKTAKKLGITRTSLYSLLKNLNIQKEE